MRERLGYRLGSLIFKIVRQWVWAVLAPPPAAMADTEALGERADRSQAASKGPVSQSRRTDRMRPDRRRAYAIPLIIVALVAAELRLFHIEQAYELFLDEAIYTQIAQNFARHRDLAFHFHGDHFYVHPPLNLLLQAGYERALSIEMQGPIALIDYTRIMCAFFGAGNAALIFLIVTSVSGRNFGLLAGAVYAVDPFIVRFDSRVLLETSAVFWALVGVAILVTAPSERGVSRGRAVIAGIAFGLSLLTKETAAALFLVPLGVCLILGAPISRRTALLILGAIAATFAPYPIIAFAIGDGRQFIDQQLNGVFRMIGTTQTTGFNAPGTHPSLTSRVIANLPTQYPSYLLIISGLCAMILILRTRAHQERIVGLFVLGGFALLSYQIALGTIEEQMFYYLSVPSVLAVGCARTPVLASIGTWGRRALAVFAGFVVVSASVIWWHIHFVPDDGLRRSVLWVEHAAKPGDAIAPLVDTSQYLITGYPLVQSGEMRDLRAGHVTWVLTSSLQVNQGYGLARPNFIRQLRRRARVVHETHDRTNGTITVWRMRQ